MATPHIDLPYDLDLGLLSVTAMAARIVAVTADMFPTSEGQGELAQLGMTYESTSLSNPDPGKVHSVIRLKLEAAALANFPTNDVLIYATRDLYRYEYALRLATTVTALTPEPHP